MDKTSIFDQTLLPFQSLKSSKNRSAGPFTRASFSAAIEILLRLCSDGTEGSEGRAGTVAGAASEGGGLYGKFEYFGFLVLIQLNAL